MREPTASDGARLAALVRPFRLAEAALLEPLAHVEASLARTEELDALLAVDLALLRVAPLGALPDLDMGGGEAALDEAARRAAPSSPAGGAASRPGGRPRLRQDGVQPSAGAPAPARGRPAGGWARLRTADPAPPAAGRSGAAAAAAGSSPEAAGDAFPTSAPEDVLLEELADAALAATGRARRRTAAPAPSARRGRRRDEPREGRRRGGGRPGGSGEAGGPPREAAPTEARAETPFRAAPVAPAPASTGGGHEAAATDELGIAPPAEDLLRPGLAGAPARLHPAAHGVGRPSGARTETRPPAESLAAPASILSLARTPAAAGAGLASLGRAEGAEPEVADLAWLVNEALVEQARRHGMDLS